MNITFFEGIDTITSDEYLYQWDIGQVINIYGLSFTVAPQLHFATRKSDKAYVVQSVLKDGVAQGNIPDTVLQAGANINCYIYVNNGLDKHTIKQIIIPILQREKPNDYTEPSSEEIVEIKNIFEQLQEDLYTLENKVDSYNLENVMQKDVYGGSTSGTVKNSDRLNGHADTYFVPIEKIKSVTCDLTIDGWQSDTAPYTQSITISGMTAEWIPGVAQAVPPDTMSNDELIILRENAGYITMIESAEDTLTFVCAEEKPTIDMTIRVPGVM